MDVHTLTLFENPGGVCGCPEFWGRTPDTHVTSNRPHEHEQYTTNHPLLLQNRHHVGSTWSCPSTIRFRPPITQETPSYANFPALASSSTLELRSPSPSPSGPPRETCFFWYHRKCRRGGHCPLAHRAHITWPMNPPPGFDIQPHRPCQLPLCPLREDVLELRNGITNRAVDSTQLEHADKDGVLTHDSSTDSDSSNDTDSETSESSGESSSNEDRKEKDGSNASRLWGINAITVAPPIPNHTHRPPPAKNITQISHAGVNKRRRLTPQPSTTTVWPMFPPMSSGPSNLAKSNGQPPTAPKLFPGQQLCFFWYHTGYCSRHRRRQRVYRYTHNYRTSAKEVGLPRYLDTTKHDPDCQLPFCPVRIIREENRASAASLQTELSSKIGTKSDGPMPPPDSKLQVLVDYELPEGEERADWDTDALRRAFGEIR